MSENGEHDEELARLFLAIVHEQCVFARELKMTPRVRAQLFKGESGN